MFDSGRIRYRPGSREPRAQPRWQIRSVSYLELPPAPSAPSWQLSLAFFMTRRYHLWTNSKSYNTKHSAIPFTPEMKSAGSNQTFHPIAIRHLAQGKIVGKLRHCQYLPGIKTVKVSTARVSSLEYLAGTIFKPSTFCRLTTKAIQ